MGILHKNTDFRGSETNSAEGKKKDCLWGKETGGTKKEKGSTGIGSAPQPCKTDGVHSHAAVAHLGCLIVNTTNGCYSCGQSLGLNTVIPTHFCAMFQLRKSEYSESFESERFTMTVARVVNCGEMFDDCSCANKWEWVFINTSRVSQVGRRCEKLVGHSKLCL